MKDKIKAALKWLAFKDSKYELLSMVLAEMDPDRLNELAEVLSAELPPMFTVEEIVEKLCAIKGGNLCVCKSSGDDERIRTILSPEGGI